MVFISGIENSTALRNRGTGNIVIFKNAYAVFIKNHSVIVENRTTYSQVLTISKVTRKGVVTIQINQRTISGLINPFIGICAGITIQSVTVVNSTAGCCHTNGIVRIESIVVGIEYTIVKDCTTLSNIA